MNATFLKTEGPRDVASFPRRCAAGSPFFLPVRSATSGVAHTPAMRHWATLVALLLGLSGTGYVWFARPRPPVPIERRLTEADLPGATRRTLRWWLP